MCAGTLESKKDYYHPKRNKPPIKGRNSNIRISKNGQRIAQYAPYIGIRESEYAQLKGSSLIEEGGYTYVFVEKGKGGKAQLQLVSPGHEKEIVAMFKDKKDNDFIFSKIECKAVAHSNLHSSRRQHAREIYNWYLKRSEKEKIFWRHQMEKIINANPSKNKSRTWKKIEKRIHTTPKIVTRGQNRIRLMSQNRPITFDREAVMFVSIFCLSHYREDVTITYYLI